jgi:hypothetical protein
MVYCKYILSNSINLEIYFKDFFENINNLKNNEITLIKKLWSTQD